MTIVQINAVYAFSSTGRTTEELHKALLASGHQSYVFCTDTSDTANGIYCVGTVFERKLHAFLSRLTGLQGYFSYHATRKLIVRLRKIKPDVVHLRNLHANFINLKMLLRFLQKEQIPVVITLHDCWLFTGRCCHYLQDNCDKWKTVCKNCPALHRYNSSWFFDRSTKMQRDKQRLFGALPKLAVVGVSDWVLGEAKQSFMAKNASFYRIYNWIDLERFSVKESAQKSETVPTVLCVAQNWSEQKGLYDVISVAEMRPEYDFIMVGELPPSCRLPRNIHAIGAVNDTKALAELYRNASVLLHLSHQETFGKVIAESLACGTPAVVYDTTALPELIGADCGMVVAFGDRDGAATAVDAVLTQPERFCAERCRAFAATNFDKASLIQQQIDLYCELCK